MSELIQILEQVKKKIKLSDKEKINYAIMIGNIDILNNEELLHFLYAYSAQQNINLFQKLKKRNKRIEEIILNMSDNFVGTKALLAYYYAYFVIKGRWKEAEQYIKKAGIGLFKNYKHDFLSK